MDLPTRSLAALPPSFVLAPDGRSFRLDPRDPVFFADPYPVYAYLRAHAPVARWDDASCLAIAAHGDVSRILKSRDFGRVVSPDGSGRPAASDVPSHLRHFAALEAHSLLDLEAPTHTRLRSLLTRAFVSRRIEALAPEIEHVAQELVAAFAEDGLVELVSQFAEPLPVAVIAGLIGVPREDAHLLLRWSHAMVAMYQFGRDRTVEVRADAASRDFADYLRSLLAIKRAKPGDDLLSALLVAQTEGGRLSEPELVSLVVLLLNAGHEATVHQIGNGLAAALDAGVDLAAATCDEGSTASLVEEALRFDTPLHLFRRFALVDTHVGSQPLRRGEEVALLLASANHDERVFTDADRFDPARCGNPHLAFGGGIHFCIGAPLARLELGLAFRALAGLGALRPKEPPRFRDSYHFRGVERLDLTFEARRLRA
ncbi:cytochrome P450 [Aureimonas sp. AU12]|uniref:cytochrome P450 n=1 Tax=Aureimonas sp. AU12 TaxID=1638161 RepID=UPI0009E77F4D|nr:cytochrome P450 [Aureimonas sp. AU12]